MHWLTKRSTSRPRVNATRTLFLWSRSARVWMKMKKWLSRKSAEELFLLSNLYPALLAWMYNRSPSLDSFFGLAEILAELGFIEPGLTELQTRLIPPTALGLVLIMIGAAG